jgi:hypothetical protein
MKNAASAGRKDSKEGKTSFRKENVPSGCGYVFIVRKNRQC